jgi:hypothetical protein
MYALHTFAETLTHNNTADPGATMTFVAGGALKPIGGHVLSHASATRMFLRKGWDSLILSFELTSRRSSGGASREIG